MCTSVDFSLILFVNIDSADERRCSHNALESALSPDPRHLAFAFACFSHTAYFSVCEVLTFMGSQDAEDRLPFLYISIDIENRLTIHFGFMNLRRFRAFGKVLHEDDSGQRAAKDSIPIPQIIDHAFSFPAYSRMACVDGFGLGSTEETEAHDEQDDCRCDQLSELHDDSLPSFIVRRLQSQVCERAPVSVCIVLTVFGTKTSQPQKHCDRLAPAWPQETTKTSEWKKVKSFHFLLR